MYLDILGYTIKEQKTTVIYTMFLDDKIDILNYSDDVWRGGRVA